MKSLLLFTLLLGAAPSAFAHDSLWLLCQGTGVMTTKDMNGHPLEVRNGIAVSLFDSRYQTDKRLDTVKMIFGGRNFDGSLIDLDMIMNENTPAKALELKEGKQSMFKGQIQVLLRDRDTTLNLTGTMRDGYDSTSRAVSPYKATLNCTDMHTFGDD